MTWIYFLLFVFGLATGSFLNVAILRYRPDKFLFSTTSGRSMCLKCNKKLSWYELIPLISFFIQRRKCRGCQGLISWQYPIVEFLAGIVTVGVPFILGKTYFITQSYLVGESINWFIILSILWILSFYILIVSTIIDFRFKIIPNEANGILGLLGVLILFSKFYFNKFSLTEGSFLGKYASMFGFRENIFANHFLAFLLIFLFFILVILLSKGKGMGMGDAKMAGALGLIFGWPDAVMIMMIAFIIGAVFGVWLIIRDRGNIKATVPFGPFLSLASLIVFIFGEVILDIYFSLFGIF